VPDPASVRHRLIDAAEHRFRRYGYGRTTVEEIAADAATSKGSVYLHFPSKQAVYLAVVEAGVERFIQRATYALAGRDPVPVRLRHLVEATVEHYGNDELLRASLFGDSDLVDGDVARLAAILQRRRITGLLAETLRAGIDAGQTRADLDPDHVAAVLFEIGWATVRAALQEDNDLPLSVALDVLNTIADRGITARPDTTGRGGRQASATHRRSQ
jgi:AcrR family transcriptional regulator